MPERSDFSRSPLDFADQAPWDAIVVGAGPAGAMAARELAAAGCRVLLVEKKRFPRWKICGACLNGQALATLRAAGLGSLITRLGAIELDQFHVAFRGRGVRVSMPEGAAVSRAKLDAALVEAAVSAGACFLDETLAEIGETSEATRRVRVTCAGQSHKLSARVVLAATGLAKLKLPQGSAVKVRARTGSRIGAGCVVDDAPGVYERGTIFMAVGREGYVGAVRVESGQLNVAAAFSPAMIRRCDGTASAAAAVMAEAGLPPITGLASTRWHGTAALTRRARPLAENRLLLLGDAAGYVEPFTGEGIAWALASGSAVVPIALRAIERWDSRLASDWQAVHRHLIGRRQLLCCAIAFGLRQPWLAALGFEVLRRAPAAAGLVIRRLNAPSGYTTASEPCPS